MHRSRPNPNPDADPNQITSILTSHQSINLLERLGGIIERAATGDADPPTSSPRLMPQGHMRGNKRHRISYLNR